MTAVPASPASTFPPAPPPSRPPRPSPCPPGNCQAHILVTLPQRLRHGPVRNTSDAAPGEDEPHWVPRIPPALEHGGNGFRRLTAVKQKHFTGRKVLSLIFSSPRPPPALQQKPVEPLLPVPGLRGSSTKSDFISCIGSDLLSCAVLFGSIRDSDLVSCGADSSGPPGSDFLSCSFLGSSDFVSCGPLFGEPWASAPAEPIHYFWGTEPQHLVAGFGPSPADFVSGKP